MAADSIYSFLNSTFNFITYSEIISLIEGAYFRAIFNYYIFRNKEKSGVLIPDYAMRYIDPSSTFKYRETKEDGNVNIHIVEYQKVKIDMATDMKMVIEAFTWATHLITVLNKDEEGYLQKRYYGRVFNMIMTLFVNTTTNELQKNIQFSKSLLKLFNLISESSVAKTFNNVGHIDSVESMLKHADSFKSKQENKLH